MEEIVIKITDIFTPEIRKKLEKLCLENKLEVTFKYISDFKSTWLLRNYVSELCSMCGLDKTWISRITLVTDELNNNAIEYWSKAWEYNKMIFKLKKDWEYKNIEIIVEDTWNWKWHKTASEMEKLREQKLKNWFDDHNSIRWRGLFLIIEKLADELVFEDSDSWGLRVIVRKKIKD